MYEDAIAEYSCFCVHWIRRSSQSTVVIACSSRAACLHTLLYSVIYSFFSFLQPALALRAGLSAAIAAVKSNKKIK